MTDEVIDVILPVRQNSLRLHEVLVSLIKQDFQHWRLIALMDRDDGRNRRAITEQMGYRPVLFIECNYEVQGFSAMLNMGLAVATARYVARQDDDDVSSDSRFTRQVKLLDDYPNVLVATGFATVYDISENLLYQTEQPDEPKELGRAVIRANIIPHSSVMFRREAVVRVGGYDERVHLCEDYDLWLRILRFGEIRSIGHGAVETLFHTNGMSRSPISILVIYRLNLQRLRTCRYLEVSLWAWAAASLKWSLGVLVAPRVGTKFAIALRRNVK